MELITKGPLLCAHACALPNLVPRQSVWDDFLLCVKSVIFSNCDLEVPRSTAADVRHDYPVTRLMAAVATSIESQNSLWYALYSCFYGRCVHVLHSLREARTVNYNCISLPISVWCHSAMYFVVRRDNGLCLVLICCLWCSWYVATDAECAPF